MYSFCKNNFISWCSLLPAQKTLFGTIGVKKRLEAYKGLLAAKVRIVLGHLINLHFQNVTDFCRAIVFVIADPSSSHPEKCDKVMNFMCAVCRCRQKSGEPPMISKMKTPRRRARIFNCYCMLFLVGIPCKIMNFSLIIWYFWRARRIWDLMPKYMYDGWQAKKWNHRSLLSLLDLKSNFLMKFILFEKCNKGISNI